MTRIFWKNGLLNACFALNCLLLFFAFLGAKMEVPGFLQVTGRMHPLLLHFPITLLIVAGFLEIGIKARNQSEIQRIGDALLLVSAATASLTALMGLFLSKEGGYEPDTLFWHQWSGIGVSLIAYTWYSFRESIRRIKYARNTVVALSMLALLVAGHKGATLTHGENYLFAPLVLKEKETQVPLEKALVFEHVVRPILKEKCMNCHNSAKMKGDLNMESAETLLKGGKNGALWDAAAAEFGLLLQRVHLSSEEKEHMPPAGKPQLSTEELGILYQWIKKGADFKLKVSDLPENDTLRSFAMGRLETQKEPPYPFRAASESTIAQLNNDFRLVAPIALKSPALSVEFFGASAFKSEHLTDLKSVKDQIVRLNLSKMPFKDADLQAIAAFTNLRKLNLSFTAITGSTLAELKTLKGLTSLSLSGTSVKIDNLEILKDLSQLRELFLWNTGVSATECEALQKQYPGVHIEFGFKGDGIVARLNAPIIEGDEQVFSTATKVHLKNYIQGAELRYTLDGTVPDSLNSLVFKGDSIVIDKSCQLITKAFLTGWVSSETSTRSYYKTGFLPDSVVLIYPPNVQYKGEGPITIANKKIGDTDFRTNKWLGYKETNLEAFLLFNQPKTVSSVSFSTMVDIGSYILPAAEVQVWGGSNQKDLVLMKKLVPQQPDKVGMPAYRQGFNCSFEARKVSVIKIVAIPVKKLPSWHPGKGEMGWVFLDEVFLE